MTRYSSLKTDPAKVSVWKRRSALKAISKRKATTRPSPPPRGDMRNALNRGRNASAAAITRKRRGISRKPGKRIGPGRRMKAWTAVWRWLKPQLEKAGRTQCEFDFIPHQCFGELWPCHSKKRREMKGSDIYAVAIGCQQIARHLDEELSHEEMEAAVLKAINNHGGIILPETKEEEGE